MNGLYHAIVFRFCKRPPCRDRQLLSLHVKPHYFLPLLE